MNEWIEVKLGSLFEVNVGGDLRSECFSLKADELYKFPIYSNSLENKGLYGFTSNPRHPANSITITGRGFLGHAEYRDIDFDAIVRLLVLTPKQDVDCRFITYLINGRINFAIESTGVPQLTAPRIVKTKVAIPERLAEQTAIATLLSKVDEAIAATQNSIQAAEKLKKALMQNLLTGKLKPDGSWRTEDEFYEDEKFGKVPMGWEVKSVDELVNRKTDTIDPVKSTEIFDYVGLEHIAQGEFVRIGKGKSDETLALKVIFEKGDLLYGKLRPYLNKVWVADISGVGSTEFLVFEKNEFTEWVYLNFQTKRFLDFTLSMTAGTQHPRAGWRDVKRFLIIKPSEYSELQLISNKILATEKDKLSKQTKIQTLQRLKKSLMQNLLTGKVRLPQGFIAQFENEVAEPKPIETEN